MKYFAILLTSILTTEALAHEVPETSNELLCIREAIDIDAPEFHLMDINQMRFNDSLSFTVTNNLDIAISAVSIEYSLATEGRSVPWTTGSQSIRIPGGIEPSESREVALAVYNLSNEAKETKPSITINLLNVYDPTGNYLFDDNTTIIGDGFTNAPSDYVCE